MSKSVALLLVMTLLVGASSSVAQTNGHPNPSWEETLAQRRNWWSLQPLRSAHVPEVRNASWSGDPVDRFILSKLESASLAPSEAADKRTLIRRLSLVLTGLPPTPEETRAFAASRAQGDYERLVSRLLASPQFGERWARHWLDVVRFSETHGNEWNYEVHHAWRYRDYLIRAFNEDVPFDQFVREHIAGDLLASPRWNHREQFNESVIGTAFYRFGEVSHDDCIGLPQIGFDLADNQIDTLTKAFQATTVACARCHDHKIDAVSTKDYYALLGILRSSRQVSHSIDTPEVNEAAIEDLRILKRKLRDEIGDLWTRDAGEVPSYLLAAQASIARGASAPSRTNSLDQVRLRHWVRVLTNNAPALEAPLSFWRALHPTNQIDAARSGSLWKQTAARYAHEAKERSEFNRTNFVPCADFRSASFPEWHVGGQGLRQGQARHGEFTLHAEGDAVVQSVLPAGVYTHLISQKLNGTLRSPPLTNGIPKISFQVLGRRSSALRLVSNNCQLNYRNYRALTTDALQWVTFSPPDDAESLRVYAELITMFDNPKFPDQLSGLGGDPANYKIPWEKAAEDPRSYFGIARVVIHSTDSPPKPELTHLKNLWAGSDAVTDEEIADRYGKRLLDAVTRWRKEEATEDDVTWLEFVVKHDLIGNRRDQSQRLESLVSAYRAAERTLSVPRVVPGLADFGPGFDQPLLARGDCAKPMDAVPRRYLEVLESRFPPASMDGSGSGRLELARRIAAPNNPLTARVMVNRIWKHLFGEGLVRTVDDFGQLGEAPSHPELLDYLARQFIQEDWSIKRLIRTIVLSKTFQSSARPSQAAREIDPQNRLLQHYPARRMEAEAIRDSILTVSGRLDRLMYGMSVQPYREKDNSDRRLFAGPLDGQGRRSVYIKVNLMESPKFLSAFNIPGGKVCQGRRDSVNVPAQSLALLNDPFVLQQADRWSRQIIASGNDSLASRIDAMFEAALGRAAEPSERQRFIQTAEHLAELHGIGKEEIMRSAKVWKDLAHSLFNLKEFIFVP
jgi:hypothetical protein